MYGFNIQKIINLNPPLESHLVEQYIRSGINFIGRDREYSIPPGEPRIHLSNYTAHIIIK